MTSAGAPDERAEEARLAAAPKELFADYAARWIDERHNSKGEPLRALTQKDYCQVLGAYLMPTFGKKPVDRITRPDVRAWNANLNKATPRARTKAYALLRAIMNSAVDDELIADSPVHIRGVGAAAVRRPVEPATPAEIQVMADNMPPRLSAALMIAAWCALRYGEIAELRRKRHRRRPLQIATPGAQPGHADHTRSRCREVLRNRRGQSRR